MRRSGFTIIEVVVALTILLVVLTGLGMATGRLVRTVAVADRGAIAREFALDRLQRVQADPDYGGLDSLYGGTENGLPGFPDLQRSTLIVRTGGSGQNVDYKTITVSVSGPGLVMPVRRSTIVGAP